MPALVEVLLRAAPPARRIVPLLPEVRDQIRNRRGAIVAGEDDQGVLGGTALVEGLEHLADGGVGFRHEVRIGTQPRTAGEFRRRQHRRVR